MRSTTGQPTRGRSAAGMSLRRSRLVHNGRLLLVCRKLYICGCSACYLPHVFFTRATRARDQGPTCGRVRSGCWQCSAACRPCFRKGLNDENAPCPLMELLLLRAALKEGIVLDVGANGGCEITAALRQGMGGGARTPSLILGHRIPSLPPERQFMWTLFVPFFGHCHVWRHWHRRDFLTT